MNFYKTKEGKDALKGMRSKSTRVWSIVKHRNCSRGNNSKFDIRFCKWTNGSPVCPYCNKVL